MGGKQFECGVPSDGETILVETPLVDALVSVVSREPCHVDNQTRMCEAKMRIMERESMSTEGVDLPSNFYDDELVCSKCAMILHGVRYSLNKVHVTDLSDEEREEIGRQWKRDNQ